LGESIVVIDYGMGNLRSVARALEHVADSATVRITDSPADIAAADRVVFPGQGAARDCMANIQKRELAESILQAFSGKPFLGICMGLQVLFEHSDENDGVECLGKIPGNVVRFERPATDGAGKIPHMGWNRVLQQGAHPLWNGIADYSRFYFVHSYYVAPSQPGWSAASTDYLQSFTSAIARDNVFATQFHPEKSAAAGLQLLHNFVRWNV